MCRPTDLRLGTTLHAQGSCYLELGSTKVAAAVYGPREVARRSEFSTTGQLSCELKFAPFSCRRRRGYIPDDQERELSQTLRTALEPAVCLVSGLRLRLCGIFGCQWRVSRLVCCWIIGSV